MESKDTIVLHPEDFEDFHKLAAKLFNRDPSQPGRPTKEEQEFRVFLTEFRYFKTLKQTGVFDKFFSELSSTKSSSEHTERVRQTDRTKDKGLLEGFLEGFISSKTLKKYQEVLRIGDDSIEDIIKTTLHYAGPIVGCLAVIWYAEEFIKLPTNRTVDKEVEVPIYEKIPIYETTPQQGRPPLILRYEQGKQIGTEKKTIQVKETMPFPPVLHTIFDILHIILLMTTTITKFVGGLANFDIFKGIGDAIQSTPQAKGQKKRADMAAEKISTGDYLGAAWDITIGAFIGTGKLPPM
ncbi:MAG: hypothetical protein V3V00_16165 [Saprospiraceae bacterium]